MKFIRPQFDVDATHGNQVFKFSPDGKVLLTLGKAGGAASPDYFYQPNDVITAPNGDIFVSEGHGAGNNRVLKFDKTGKFIKEWGKLGTGPGDFDQPSLRITENHAFGPPSLNERSFMSGRTSNLTAWISSTSQPFAKDSRSSRSETRLGP